jgi:hypothetical protein
MKKSSAIVLIALTIWPFIYMFLFMGGIFFAISHPGPSHADGPPLLMKVILPLHLLTMLEMMGLLVFYIVHLFRTNRVAPDKKALWAIVLFMGNMISMPFYWYFYIWKPLNELPPA